MMSISDNYCVICLESIKAQNERTKVVNSLFQSNKEVIEINEKQLNHFAGNILQIRNDSNLFLLMSGSAYRTIDYCQIERLLRYNAILNFPIPTIEKYEGWINVLSVFLQKLTLRPIIS